MRHLGLAHLGDLGAQFVHDVDETRLEADLEIAWAGQVDGLGHDDAAGPRAHDMHVVGEERRLAEVVRDEDDREADLLPEIAQDAPQLLPRKGVEGGEGLVQHQQRRLVDEGAAQGNALLHAAGQLPRVAVAEPVEADGREQRPRLLAILGLFSAEAAPVRLDDLERQEDVVDDLAPGQQVRVLESHAGDLDRPAHPVAEDDDLAGIRRHEPGDQLHQRGLAAAGRADDGGELAAADGERRILQGEHAARHALIGERHVLDVDEGGRRAGLGQGRAAIVVATASGRRARVRRGQQNLAQSFRSAAGGRYWLVKMSAALGRFLNS